MPRNLSPRPLRARPRKPGSGKRLMTARAPAVTLVDFESRSRVNLKRRGPRAYWADESTEAIVAVLRTVYGPGDIGPAQYWFPGDRAPRLSVAVAHNAIMFDRFAAEACGWRVDKWLDSSHAARRAGLPGALDALAQRWVGRAKDKEGNKLTLSMSRPSRAKARKGLLPDLTRDVTNRIAEYCANDVDDIAEAYDRLEPWFDVDAETQRADQAVNDRGVFLNPDLVAALQRELSRLGEQAVSKAAKALGMTETATRTAARSVPQFTERTGLPNAQAATLIDWKAYGALLDHPLVAARRALASVVPGKLIACKERVCPDGRIRDSHVYHGAHTGRWSSKGIQLHNLPRASFEGEAKKADVSQLEYLQSAIAHALAGGELTNKEVSVLLRSVLCAAPRKLLAVLDYSGIEARVNAWAAGDTEAVDVFRALDAGTGPDPYKVMAAKIFSVAVDAVSKEQRGLGKIAELMLGYGAGADKFADSCEKSGVVLADFGLSGEDIVHAYRYEAHRAVVEQWRKCERAFAAACGGASMKAGPWLYCPIGNNVACVLPSQRPIVYPNARARRVQRTGRSGQTFQAWDLAYDGHRHVEHVYGGLLTENAVQAFSRDLLADSLIRCEAAGLNPVLHVHDELVCEVDAGSADEAFAEMRQIMATPPRWARGLPIRLDGFTGKDYRK